LSLSPPPVTVRAVTARTAYGALAVALVLASSAQVRAFTEDDFARKPFEVFHVATQADGTPIDTVIGDVRLYRIRKGDTLIDLARYYDLGYNEIVEANPGIDPWVPPVGATILLPTQYVLPCCTYVGIVVNIPEMRLFYYQHLKGSPTMTIHTFPVGLGRDDWPTPRAKFRIRGKTVNPTWVIPESIREEHIRERNDPRKLIPGGAPDNPLGKYRLELTLPLYGIHGTDIPWGVGMQVSHGCVRLYPEDIERLFPLVPVGTPGEFTYQTVKVGARGGTVFVEMHDDIYGQTPARYHEALEAIQRRGLAPRVDEARLLSALEDGARVPEPISPQDGSPVAMVGSLRDDRAAGPDDRETTDD
jgi:L,D-transpeptidase ErfK/SrfK